MLLGNTIGRTLVLVMCALVCAHAVETSPLPVLKVIDGDTLDVASDLGGLQHPVRVRLLYIDTAESRANKHGEEMAGGHEAKDLLSKQFAAKSRVALWGPKDALEVDGYGRVLAIVEMAEPDQKTPPAGNTATVQEIMISNGYSVYWRKYGDAPEPWNALFVAAQLQAKESKAGMWGTDPQWMTDKANERTAPKASTTPKQTEKR